MWTRGRGFALYLALAVAWTWPAAISGDTLGARADALGTIWFVSAASRLAGSFHDVLTGWPDGATYLRPDSLVLLAVSAVLPLAPARIVALVAVLGLTLSALAADALARALGARAPWSLLAGIAYAFSGLASTAWVEGYAYHLADPWLPLLVLAWMRALGPEGRLRDGAAAGLCFALALATSAWHGLAAGLLLVGLLVGARVARVLRPGPAAVGLLVVLAAGGLYVASFFQRGGGAANVGGMSWFAERLLRHLVPGPSIDIDGRGQTAWSSTVMLALFAVAPLVLPRDWRRTTLAVIGAISLGLAVFPLPWNGLIQYAPPDVGHLLGAVRAELDRFPERLGWAWLLAGAVIAARTATALSERAGAAAWPLLGIAVVEMFAAPRLPFRQFRTPAGAPSAYAAAEGPVLDLWPEDLAPEPGWELRLTNTGCFYQAAHHRPIAEICLLSPGATNPRARIGAWATDRALAGDAEGLGEGLAKLGFTTVAFHPDLFRVRDRTRIRATLDAVDPSPTISRDAGDHVVAYAIAGAADAESARLAYAALTGYPEQAAGATP